MKKNTRIITGIIFSAAVFAAGGLKADSFSFGVGKTPYGKSLSIGYSKGHRHCSPAPRRVRVRSVPSRPVVVVQHRPVGHYETRVERYWVDGCWTQNVRYCGRVMRVWHPGYWSERTVRIWVNH